MWGGEHGDDVLAVVEVVLHPSELHAYTSAVCGVVLLPATVNDSETGKMLCVAVQAHKRANFRGVGSCSEEASHTLMLRTPVMASNLF